MKDPHTLDSYGGHELFKVHGVRPTNLWGLPRHHLQGPGPTVRVNEIVKKAGRQPLTIAPLFQMLRVDSSLLPFRASVFLCQLLTQIHGKAGDLFRKSGSASL